MQELHFHVFELLWLVEEEDEDDVEEMVEDEDEEDLLVEKEDEDVEEMAEDEDEEEDLFVLAILSWASWRISKEILADAFTLAPRSVCTFLVLVTLFFAAKQMWHTREEMDCWSLLTEIEDLRTTGVNSFDKCCSVSAAPNRSKYILIVTGSTVE